MSAQKGVSKATSSIAASTGSTYPEPFRAAVAARRKRALGDAFGLTAFGVNLVELAPGNCSSQRHWHSHEDELVYVLEGELTLITEGAEEHMQPGDVVAFKAGVANGHQLRNDGKLTAVYLEVGNRHDADEVFYPDIDLELRRTGTGRREFRHRNGEAW